MRWWSKTGGQCGKRQGARGNMAAITKLWDAYMATYLTPEEAEIANRLAEHRRTYMCSKVYCQPSVL